MSGLILPPAEPPADDVRQVLERLRLAREQQAEAARLIAVLGTAQGDEQPADVVRAEYWRIENEAAERRAELWNAVVAGLEAEARSLGLRP